MFRSVRPIKKISRKVKLPGFFVLKENFTDRKVVFRAGETAYRFFQWMNTAETIKIFI